MTNVTSSTSTPAITGTNGTQGTTLSPASNPLGENQFLMLMMDQLKNQDPLSPDDPTQYLSELASFSSLEQETQVAQSTASAATQQASGSALALLGHTVNYTDGNGVTQSGTVSKVDFGSSGPTLTIGADSGIPLGNITEAS